jgi:sensor histidine kinase YesM
MTQRTGILLAGFFVLYYMLHLAYDLPNVIHGTPSFEWWPLGIRHKLILLLDIGIAFLFSVLPYLILIRNYPQRRYLFSALLILVSIAGVFFLQFKSTEWGSAGAVRLRTFFTGKIFFDSIYVLYGIIFYFIRYAYFRELEQRELLIQNRQAELQFLRSQLNPHFLFNSLNNIYALVYANSSKALPAIAELSELLRYMLYHSEEKVALDKELDYIRKYIGLQKLRYEQPIHAELFITGSTTDIAIAPLVLIPFIENAFKHGDFSTSNAGLVVTIQAYKEKLMVFCLNRKGNHQRNTEGGIGLENVKRRLELLYPGKHILRIDDKKESFAVNLELIYD